MILQNQSGFAELDDGQITSRALQELPNHGEATPSQYSAQ